MRWRLWLRRTLVAIAALAGVTLASIPLWSPALAAAACPACYGMQHIAPRVYVDAGMAPVQRRAVLAAIGDAETTVASFYGRRDRQPIVLACGDDVCDRRLGGGGARATTYSTIGHSVLRLSPRGLDRTIIAHELSHVQVHAMIGVRQQMTGAVAAWFDEGLAVVVSEDERYLTAGTKAAGRCVATPDAILPTSPFVWGPQSGKTPWLYAKAACEVLRWMEANGGRDGVLAALRDVGEGKRNLP